MKMDIIKNIIGNIMVNTMGGGAKIRLWKTIDKGQYETEKKHSVPKL